jgi:hypothetical protein
MPLQLILPKSCHYFKFNILQKLTVLFISNVNNKYLRILFIILTKFNSYQRRKKWSFLFFTKQVEEENSRFSLLSEIEC